MFECTKYKDEGDEVSTQRARRFVAAIVSLFKVELMQVHRGPSGEEEAEEKSKKHSFEYRCKIRNLV